MKEKDLKYPTFKSFLEALNKMDWTASTAHSITFGEGFMPKSYEIEEYPYDTLKEKLMELSLI